MTESVAIGSILRRGIYQEGLILHATSRLLTSLLATLALLFSQPAQAAVNAEAEVAAAMFAASATLAAYQKTADAKLRAERERIVALRAQLKRQRAGAAAATAAQREAEANLAAAERDFVAQLAEKDRAFAQEIAVFRDQVKDIAATPEGAEALAMFNDGDEIGAIEILDKLRAANDAARERRVAIESAAEGRRIAARSAAGSVGAIALAAMAFNLFGVASKVCTIDAMQPGLSDSCGAIGLGNRPSKAERVA